jgi:hypothetical protein
MPSGMRSRAVELFVADAACAGIGRTIDQHAAMKWWG